MAINFSHSRIFLMCLLSASFSRALSCSNSIIMNTTAEVVKAEVGDTRVLTCLAKNYHADYNYYFYKSEEGRFTSILWSDIDNEITDNQTTGVKTLIWSTTLENIQRIHSPKYLCVLKNGTTCPKLEKSFKLVVEYPPLVRYIGPQQAPFWSALHPTRLSVNETDNFTMTCNADGEPKPFITWYYRRLEDSINWKEISVGTDDNKHGNYTICNLSRKDSGMYKCETDNSKGSHWKEVELVVQYAPEVYTTQKVIHAAPESKIVLSCNITSSPRPSDIYWMKNDSVRLEPEPNPEQNVLLIVRFNKDSDYGNYTCIVENLLGTASATIEVSGSPIAPYIINESEQGRMKHSFKLQWSPFSTEDENDIRIDEYVIRWQRKAFTTVNGRRKEVYVPQEPNSDRVPGDRRSFTIRDLKKNSTYRSWVCPSNNYGLGDCVEYQFRTSTEDYVQATAKASPVCSPENCEKSTLTWQPNKSSEKSRSSAAMVTLFSAGLITWHTIITNA